MSPTDNIESNEATAADLDETIDMDNGQDTDEMDTESTKKDSDNAESSSYGSSDGKGSGSGGGYSADCSASDQSSDENGMRKNSKAKEQGSKVKEVESKESESKQESGGNNTVKHRKQQTAKKIDQKAPTDNNNSKPIEKVISRKKASDAHGAEGMMKYKEKAGTENTSLFVSSSHPLPQWNGFRISHPMDPRIDLSTVGFVRAADVPVTASQQYTESVHPGQTSSAPSDSCLEHYEQLMEVVRPFFDAHGIGVAKTESQQSVAGSSSEAFSSEGFTSFFTTTNTGSGNSGSHDGSDDTQAKKAEFVDNEACYDNTDSLSMVVLARVKRKHRKGSQESEENTSNGSSRSSGQKRNWMQDTINNDNENNDESKQSDASERRSGGDTSSTSSRHNPPAEMQQGGQINVPPHLVTDVSSSNRTDSTSNGQSGSADNTGSGSNQGSSNEGKGSSEENKEENSGTNEGSDESIPRSKKHKVAQEASPDRKELHEQRKRSDSVADAFDRERKIQDKKRKRIEMRREYEAQQQFESSESSNQEREHLLKPGKAVTMDQVLMFSKIPRIIIQATPPFLVVHTNAAYTRLTGIDAHAVVGHPIASLLFIKREEIHTANGSASPISNGDTISQAQGHALAAAEAAGRARATEAAHLHESKYTSIERLVASSGFGHLRTVDVKAKPQQMVGCNLTIEVKGSNAGTHDSIARNRDEGSNATSITSSYKVPASLISCRTSIAPIVSMPFAMDHRGASGGLCSSTAAKRRKAHYSPEGATHEVNPPIEQEMNASKCVEQNKLITHYVIQLEFAGNEMEGNDSAASLSSNSSSVEARLQGITKADLQRQRMAAGLNDNDEPFENDVASESTGTKEPVSAVG